MHVGSLVTILSVLCLCFGGVREANADELARAWQYVTDYPATGWQELKFDDAGWQQGNAGFGATNMVKAEGGTEWASGQIWLRQIFELRHKPGAPQLYLKHRGDVQVYINGSLVADFTGNTPRFVPVPIQGEAQASLREGRNLIAVHATAIGDSPFVDVQLQEAAGSGSVTAPVFRDPRFDGAADPTVIWDRINKVWRLFYTQRRANLKELPGVGYCFGSDIGMAVSSDGGRTWVYNGEARGLEYEGGRNTLWAPEVFFAKGEYHMLVTYIKGVFTRWGGNPILVHFTSTDLKNWKFVRELPLKGVIDGSVAALPAGGWRIFFKRENRTFMADSVDLENWKEAGTATADEGQEGPDVFRWKGRYWMIADVWHGQAVYSSRDLSKWDRQEGTILGAPPGKRRDDAAYGRHADVLVQNDRAFIIYFTHPGGDTDHEQATSLKRTSIQVAELEYRDGRIVCDRDKPLDYRWKSAE